MSTPARSPRPNSLTPKPEIVSDGEKSSFLGQFYGLVSDRAYSLFEAAGGFHGEDLSHWLRAETDLAALADVKEAGNIFTVDIRIPGGSPDQIRVCATNDKAVICSQTVAQDDTGQGFDGTVELRQSVYYMIRWPEPIDPDSCKAEFAGDKLILSARKALPIGGATEGSAASRSNSAQV